MIKRSTMVLYTDSSIESHTTRFVLAEKEVNVDIVSLDHSDEYPEDFIAMNPQADLPFLVDRELTLTTARIIVEYVDERFPHPPLLPVYPVSRAKFRLMIHHLSQDWLAPLASIVRGEHVEVCTKQLHDRIVSVLPVFERSQYFMGEGFSLVDCYIAPVLWRLPHYNIQFEEAHHTIIEAYAQRVFSRHAFQASLTDDECDLRELGDF